MNPKTTTAILVVAAILGVTGVLVFGSKKPRASVTVTLRLSVAPRDQMEYVLAHGQSARFKYEIGKVAGLKPFLAQKLSLKGVPDSALVEARVGVQTRAEAKAYADAFVEMLQAQCGTQATLTLAHQTIR